MRTSAVEAEQSTSTDDDILHWTCCDADIAFCGQDVSGHEWTDEGNLCSMCDLIDEYDMPCPVPGCRPELRDE